MEAFYRLWYPRLFRFLYRLCRQYGQTEELVNDVMLIVWRKAPEFRYESRVSTWVFGIAHRCGLKALRGQSPATVEYLDEREGTVGFERGVERRDWVQRALSRLPAEHRATVEMVFYLGLSYREIGEIQGCPENTIKTRMYHARRRLRESFESLSEEVVHDDGTRTPTGYL